MYLGPIEVVPEKLNPHTLFKVLVFSVQGMRLTPASAHLKAGFPEFLALFQEPHEDLRLTDWTTRQCMIYQYMYIQVPGSPGYALLSAKFG